ncbi:aspartate-semialdehyde dehydrogenase [Wolbachia endosymbiont of Howardula sp.]|uniref:aspartate-semialdehyde dehydrogenase n=1 Tax=Wolbachia endosymbiont of Howardula sp. TaxID=2916816 RepID=UPI00217DD3CB|nr:aspartate-semialdehyde dehydrogenase [Wolbachia endosymbiont of Howardula sp.]UWI83404.1 aspartate-semialdehyde dehydrogenase [Wolbachia endosymbiont of Howardula sp.]
MQYKIAVVGATGSIGRKVLSILAEFQNAGKISISTVVALASYKSSGRKVSFGNTELTVCCLKDYNFSGMNIAIFCAGAYISEQYISIATAAGCIVIDNSSYFSMHTQVPLIIPEINKNQILRYKNLNIISNPNCNTIHILLALYPLHQRAHIKRIVASTYQSTSGIGNNAMNELYYQTKKIFMNENHPPEIFSKQIAFNCIPHIGEFMHNGATEEELTISEETKKILDEEIKMNVTCVRVPVFIGDAISVNVEFCSHLTKEQARKILNADEENGILVCDNPQELRYTTHIDVVGEDAVYISRIREDETVTHGLNMWIVSDNLRKGAALNIIQILTTLVAQMHND